MCWHEQRARQRTYSVCILGSAVVSDELERVSQRIVVPHLVRTAIAPRHADEAIAGGDVFLRSDVAQEPAVVGALRREGQIR